MGFVCFAKAKINLGLKVLSRQSDGFHHIETVMTPTPASDVIEFKPAEKTTLKVTGLPIEASLKDNLILKADALVRKDYDYHPLDIHLHKIIPIGAGLGGGSSDAVNYIKGLDAYFNLKISKDQMLSYANQLGSDCAFFIEEQPKKCLDRGNVFEPAELFDFKNHYLVLINLGIHISTKLAYQNLILTSQKKEIDYLNINSWKDTMVNDFEVYAFAQHPTLKALKQELYEIGARFSLMSGSGSTIYAIFDDYQKAEVAIEKYKADYFTFISEL